MSTELERVDGSERPFNYKVKKLPNEIVVLVLGILSIVGCCFYAIPGLILSIVALVLSKRDKLIYASDPMAYENSYKNLKAGKICAIVGLSTSIAFFLFLVIYVLFFVFMMTATASMATSAAAAAAEQNSYPY